jgi:methylase of polypeptide subunit release factors
MPDVNVQDQALLDLLRQLGGRGYRFITPTPETHRRVVARACHAEAHDLAGIFGWNRPFAPGIVDPGLLRLMRSGGIVEAEGDLLRSTLRVSSLDDMLFFHSAWPTTASDAVFFGPDTYRFARFLREELVGLQTPVHRLVDIGCGSGAGGLLAARLCHAEAVVLADINPAALRLAGINAQAAGISASIVHSDVFASIDGAFDLVVSNPPYLVDDAARIYRHGGAMRGADLSLRIAREAADRLEAGGRLLLYTASAIDNGFDAFRANALRALQAAGCEATYGEIDPDVWGEELERVVYATVDRIAVVGVTGLKGSPA